jgi:geranylgeranyl diphosphate synthase, type II
MSATGEHPVETAGIEKLLKERAAQVDAFLREMLQRRHVAPRRLVEAIEYSLMAGGKRLRPTLVLECAAAINWEPRTLRPGSGQARNPSALAAAAAIELIHTFSLVHDDLPAMDDDDLRRGRPTSHKVFGEAMAILAGDAMVMLAFEVLAAHADAPILPDLVRELATAAGPEGMIGGQVLDMQAEKQAIDLPQLQQIHAHKTGALLRASCRMGAVAAGAGGVQLAGVDAFGMHLGLAFQIVDDLLDVTATTKQLGKATNKDATRGKKTYPALLGMDESRQEANRQRDLAINALEPLGEGGQNLRELARFVVDRQR